MKKAYIHVFEDAIPQKDVLESTQTQIKEHLKLKAVSRWHQQFDWHPKWSCESTPIRSNETYIEAFDFCLSAESYGIACFDFKLHASVSTLVQVTDKQLETVFPEGLPEGIDEELFKSNPGLLLGWAMATNPKADVIVLLSTSNSKVRSSFEKVLKNAVRTGQVEDLHGSVPSLAGEDELATELIPWIDEFIRNHSHDLDDILDVIWQEHFKISQLKWFGGDDANSYLIPHSHGTFLGRYKTPQSRAESEVGEYLRSLMAYGHERHNPVQSDHGDLHLLFAELEEGVQEQIDTLVEWLITSERVWYLLQRVFGPKKAWLVEDAGCSEPTNVNLNKTEFPGHGTFLLLLLAATGPQNWTREDFTFATEHSPESKVRDGDYWILAHDKGNSGYQKDDLEATRGILRTAFELFIYLSKWKHADNSTEPDSMSKRLVSFTERSGCGLFSLSVNFSAMPRFDDTRKRPSILARTQFAQKKQYQTGDCLGRYESFQEACEPFEGGDRCVFSWILPGARPKGWTEFLIGVVNRG